MNRVQHILELFGSYMKTAFIVGGIGTGLVLTYSGHLLPGTLILAVYIAHFLHRLRRLGFIHKYLADVKSLFTKDTDEVICASGGGKITSPKTDLEAERFRLEKEAHDLYHKYKMKRGFASSKLLTFGEEGITRDKVKKEKRLLIKEIETMLKELWILKSESDKDNSTRIETRKILEREVIDLMVKLEYIKSVEEIYKDLIRNSEDKKADSFKSPEEEGKDENNKEHHNK